MSLAITPKSFQLLAQMARFAERRQTVLASNVANIDTLDYKMRDLDVEGFQQAMKSAVESQAHPSLNQPVSQHWGNASPGWPSLPGPLGNATTPDINSFFGEELFESQEDTARNLTFHDGNNRGIEYQMTELTKNSMQQNFAIELMSAQMRLLETVISEQIR